MKNSKKRSISLWVTVITALLTASCVNHIPGEEEEKHEVESTTDGKIPIKISTQILCAQTRVSNNEFEYDDAIGLYVLSEGQKLNQTRYVDNMRFICTSSGVVPDEDIYYPEEGGACTFFSYYPYQETGILPDESNMDVSIKANQSSASAYNISDFMVATATGITPTQESIKLNHLHKLCQLNIVVALSKEDNIEDFQKNASVSIKNIFTQATYDFITDEFTALHTPQNAVPNGTWSIDSENYKLKGKRLVLFPQQITQCEITLSINNRDFSALLPDDLILTSNQSAEITLSCDLKVGISSVALSISDWQEGSRSNIKLSEKKKNHSISIASLDFEQSNVYNIVNASNEVIAEVCKEYLFNEQIDAQAIVLYPINDKTKGTVLQILGKDENVHGGSVVWDMSTHSFTYAAGNTAPITSLYAGSQGTILFEKKEEDTPSISSSAYVLTDVRGSETIIYPIVKIGTQYWMRDNLNTAQYNSGGKISSITILTQTTAGYYSNDGNRFYNKAAVIKGILAPKGWKIPSNKEWTILKTYIGNKAATLKAGSQWLASEGITLADNRTGFNAHPIGFFTKRTDKGSSMYAFDDKYVGYWSTGDTPATLSENGVLLRFDSDEIKGMIHNEYTGYSIRCLKE